MLGFPICFNSRKEYEDWKSLAPESDDIPVTSNPHCWDCTPAYQRLMKEAGRCMRPDTTFVNVLLLEEDEPEIHGVPADVPIAELFSGPRWGGYRGE